MSRRYPAANNGAGVTLTHQYTIAGFYTVSLTATDKDLGVSPVAAAQLIVASSGQNTITLSPGANSGDIQATITTKSGNTTTTTTYGGPGQQPVHPSGALVVMGGTGNDSFIVNATVPGGLVLDGQGGGGDNYTVNCGGWEGTVTVHDSYGGSKLTVNGVAGSDPNYITKKPGVITYGSTTTPTETINDTGVNQITINPMSSGYNFVGDPSDGDTIINGGPGTNEILITAATGGTTVINGGPNTNLYTVDLGSLAGPVSINNANPNAIDTLVVNGTPGNDAITAAGAQLTAGTETIHLAAPLAQLIINSGAGNDSITAAGLSVPVQSLIADGGDGSDTYVVQFGDLTSSVTIADSGSSGTDNLTVVGTASADAVSVSATQVTRETETVRYNTALEALTVVTGVGDDTILITATAAPGVVADGGDGSDTYIVSGGSLQGPVTISDSDSAGLNAVTVYGTPGAGHNHPVGEPDRRERRGSNHARLRRHQLGGGWGWRHGRHLYRYRDADRLAHGHRGGRRVRLRHRRGRQDPDQAGRGRLVRSLSASTGC